MENIVLTVTLRAVSENESDLIEHIKKFKSGKGFQDRSFELRRLLVIRFEKEISTLNPPDAKNRRNIQRAESGNLENSGNLKIAD